MEKLVPTEKKKKMKSFVKNGTPQYGTKKVGNFNKRFSGADNFHTGHPVYYSFDIYIYD